MNIIHDFKRSFTSKLFNETFWLASRNSLGGYEKTRRRGATTNKLHDDDQGSRNIFGKNVRGSNVALEVVKVTRRDFTEKRWTASNNIVLFFAQSSHVAKIPVKGNRTVNEGEDARSRILQRLRSVTSHL